MPRMPNATEIKAARDTLLKSPSLSFYIVPSTPQAISQMMTATVVCLREDLLAHTRDLHNIHLSASTKTSSIETDPASLQFQIKQEWSVKWVAPRFHAVSKLLHFTIAQQGSDLVRNKERLGTRPASCEIER